ncbi:unnamed protein product [Sympodiomycopsis kandeliae]
MIGHHDVAIIPDHVLLSNHLYNLAGVMKTGYRPMPALAGEFSHPQFFHDAKEYTSLSFQSKSDPMETPNEDEQPPLSRSTAIDLRSLRFQVEAAVKQTRAGARVPIKLSTASKDLYYILVETYPRFRFAFLEGVVYFYGDPLSRVHGQLVEHFASTIQRFAQKTLRLGEFDLEMGPGYIKRPDVVYSYYATSYPVTIIECSWANEDVAELERITERASRHGLNAITMKVWWNGRCGKNATLHTPFGVPDLTEEIIQGSAAVILIAKAAGLNTIPTVWRMGQKAHQCQLQLPRSEAAGTVAWLNSDWFQAGPNITLPLPLISIATSVARTLWAEAAVNTQAADVHYRTELLMASATVGAITNHHAVLSAEEADILLNTATTWREQAQEALDTHLIEEH